MRIQIRVQPNKKNADSCGYGSTILAVRIRPFSAQKVPILIKILDKSKHNLNKASGIDSNPCREIKIDTKN
jgi:hypothetical protein